MAQIDPRVLPETRLRILTSLPRRHQDYFFEEVRTLCVKYITHSANRPKADRESEALELFSEVMAKLLGVSASGTTEAAEGAGRGDPQQVWTANQDPKQDGRVAWLIDEIGGRRALGHRYEDIRRRRHGGKWTGDGYREVSLEPIHTDSLAVDPDEPLDGEDSSRAWNGVLAAAAAQFGCNDDVRTLLDLMAHDDEIRNSFGSEWPIRKMVDTLNQQHPNPPWNDDRVENAKKRLRNWIVRLKRDNGGLDPTDLRALFARRVPRSTDKIGVEVTVGRQSSAASKLAFE